jgi:hypothetical protein
MAHLDDLMLLPDDDLLAALDLHLAGGRGSDPSGADRAAGVRCGRPLFAAVEVADLPPLLRSRAGATGNRYLASVYAYDLDPPEARQRFATAHFRVRFDDPGVIAVGIEADGNAIGLVQGPPGAPGGADQVLAASPIADRLAADLLRRRRAGWLTRLLPRRDEPRSEISGAQSAHFGWRYDDPAGEALTGRSYTMTALLEAPPSVAALTGTLHVDVELLHTVRGRTLRLRAGTETRFDEPLGRTPAPTTAAVRLCMAADIKGYSSLSNPDQVAAQARLVHVLAAARAHAGLAEADVFRQEQGDGQFAVLPGGIDESVVIPRLVAGLDAELRAANEGRPDGDRMRLRAALHRGHLEQAANGWVGNASIGVHRLLDSAEARRHLDEHPRADAVLIVADVVFRDVIAHGFGGLSPDEFTPVTVDMPAKRFVEHAWVRPGTVS